MKFKLGDFVRFVDEKREGYVTKIIDTQTLGVTDNDGFEIPVATSNLTFVHGHEVTDKTEDISKLNTPKSIEAPLSNPGIFLAIIDDKKATNVVRFHLVNHTYFQLLVSLVLEKQAKYSGIFSGIINANQAIEMHSLSLAELEIWPQFHLQILQHSKADVKPKEPITLNKKFRAKDFSSEKKDMALLNQKGWGIQLDETVPIIDAQKLKESFYKTGKEKKSIEIPAKETDLHIERLRDDHHFLDAEEILKIQIDYFQRVLDAAIVYRLPSIVFIHGVGNGTLRHHIHKIISKNPQVKTFMDAQKDKFGYGATEVFFK